MQYSQEEIQINSEPDQCRIYYEANEAAASGPPPNRGPHQLDQNILICKYLLSQYYVTFYHVNYVIIIMWPTANIMTFVTVVLLKMLIKIGAIRKSLANYGSNSC